MICWIISGCVKDEPEDNHATQETDKAHPPDCLNLFDLMDQAKVIGIDETAESVKKTVVYDYDFDKSVPETVWFGNSAFKETNELIDANAGMNSAGLSIGPDIPEDMNRAVFILKTSGFSQITISGRVKLENNPKAHEFSTREVLRVKEHRNVLKKPWRRSYSELKTHRVSRSIDPSGWDRFHLTFISRERTECLEIQLLHRSVGSKEAITRFDDLVIEQKSLTKKMMYACLCEHYAPGDGRDSLTPWRLRVELSTPNRWRKERRDAFLMPPPTTVSFPVTVKPNSQLRFHYSMSEEAFHSSGDGAVIDVDFIGEDGVKRNVGSVEVDPKNNPKHRVWNKKVMDLTSLSGEKGEICFSSKDIPDSKPDFPDSVLLSNPRLEPKDKAPEIYNVLMIGVDTLRADRVSALGYERPTTPNLKALADQGVRFINTRSQATWTMPSFSSILTSLYPSTHCAGRGGHDEWTPMDPSVTSLAEVLKDQGFETAGIVANGLISPTYNLDQGFETYSHSWVMESGARDQASVISFIEDHTRTPWFLFWHIMDPHLPYTTRSNFREEFTDPEYRGRFRHGVPFQDLDPRPGRRWFAHEGPPPMPNLSEKEAQFISDYYDAEVAEVDFILGKIFESLKSSGQWDRTIVAFVSDHGEGLGDHNHYHHGYTLFDDQVHIPMLLRIPNSGGETISRPVAAIDLAPTILGSLNIKIPAFFQGVDQLSKNAPRDRAIFIEDPTYDSSAQKAWIKGAFKYIHDPVFHTEALYRMDHDPKEQNDVINKYPKVAQMARKEMDRFRWEKIQKGRFHLRIKSAKGRRLKLRIRTDDLFDANFASKPKTPEMDFAMDLKRHNLCMNTVLEDDLFELVFWCRGTMLDFDIKLDGEALPEGLFIGNSQECLTSPIRLDIRDVPQLDGKTISNPLIPGQAVLWLETGAVQVKPVAPSPEDIEVLKQLGYGR